ncbi:MAG: hypothetical protein GYA14_15675 [Ignavibacteria bacterium]|nr:hypothetical protein [Ignavibacteria bacterium]
MILSYKKIFSLVLIIAGILNLASHFKLLRIDVAQIIGISFVLQSIVSVSLSLNNNRRDLLFLFTVLFLVGILFFTKSYFNIRETREIVFTSILFITGGVFLILFVDNLKEKIFLITSIVFFLSGYLSITVLRSFGITKFANSLAKTAEDFWPILLIIAGLVLFLNRKK